MENITYLGVFLVEILSLFFFSRLLTQSIGRILHRLTGNFDQAAQLFSILFLPGTIVHEMAHILMAGALLVPTGEVEFTPKLEEGRLKLGSAQIGQTDPIRRALIGVSPVIFGLLLILVSLYLITNSYQSFYDSWWLGIPAVYLIFVVANSMFSSPKDLEGTIEVLCVVVGAFVAGYLLNLYQPIQVLGSLMASPVGAMIKSATIYLLIPILIDLGVFFSAALLLKRR
ncbi:MAG: hypothetical protein Q7S88_02775 [Candidatus Daviesbacteria bacterium]|nr:hypothetical protein [Candidatus Daviesbacteria bacterium]